MKKQALIMWGGWPGHEPQPMAELFRELLTREGFAVEVFDTLDALLNPERMAKLDLAIPIWTMGTITDEQASALTSAVERGTGIAGQHGGMADAFRMSTAYQFMVGAQWVAHPDDIVEYTVNITQPNDPIVAGLRDFQMRSEQYYLHGDPSNEVLAHTTFPRREQAPWVEGVRMPVSYKRRHGQGRVFYSSLGHVVADFQVPEALEMQRRGMLWAAR